MSGNEILLSKNQMRTHIGHTISRERDQPPARPPTTQTQSKSLDPPQKKKREMKKREKNQVDWQSNVPPQMRLFTQIFHLYQMICKCEFLRIMITFALRLMLPLLLLLICAWVLVLSLFMFCFCLFVSIWFSGLSLETQYLRGPFKVHAVTQSANEMGVLLVRLLFSRIPMNFKNELQAHQKKTCPHTHTPSNLCAFKTGNLHFRAFFFPSLSCSSSLYLFVIRLAH